MHPFRIAAAFLIYVAFAAGAANAQDLCGGLSAGAEWMGGGPGGADITRADAPFDAIGLVMPGGDFVTLVEVGTPTRLRVEANPLNGGDSVVELYDAAGALVAEDDDGGIGWASRMEVDLDAGTYCLRTRSFNPDLLLAVAVRVGLPDHPALTRDAEGDTAPDAPTRPELACGPQTEARDLGSLPGPGLVTSGPVGDDAYFRFTLTGSAPLTLSAEGAEADPFLALFAADGARIAQNDDWISLDARIAPAAPLAAGSYCVGVRALRDRDAPITLRIEAGAGAAEKAGAA